MWRPIGKPLSRRAANSSTTLLAIGSDMVRCWTAWKSSAFSSVRTDLRPVWFSERLGITDAPDVVTWQASDNVFIAKDVANSWFLVWGAAESANPEPIAHPQPIQTSGRGVTAASRYSLSVDPGSTSHLTFVIAGSATEQNAAVHTYKYLAKNH